MKFCFCLFYTVFVMYLFCVCLCVLCVCVLNIVLDSFNVFYDVPLCAFEDLLVCIFCRFLLLKYFEIVYVFVCVAVILVVCML